MALAACTVAPTPPPAPPSVKAADALFAEFVHPGAVGVLRVDDDALIAVTVRRGGALARLGHDHVVAARRIEGYATPATGRAALRFRLDEMTVDEAALRTEAGLTTQPSPEAIAGTRQNMLTKVLDAEQFPWVQVRIQRVPGGAALQTDITLHGATRRYTIPTTIDTAGDGLVARGTLVLKQTDFGLVPFSVLGGAMAVQDPMEIRFVIGAHAMPTAPRR